MTAPASPRVLLTGASSGLGAALAHRYARGGASLALLGRDEARLEAVAQACRGLGAEAETARLDVRDAEALDAAVRRFDDRAPLNVLVASAGVSASVAPGGRTEGLESVALQVGVNLLGAVAAIEPAAERMAQRGSGSIAVVSSIAGLRGLPYSPGYSASKAGVRAYGEALRALLAPRGVHVLVATPGFFDTPMTARWQGDAPWLRSADRVAGELADAIAARQPRYGFPWPLGVGLRLADLGPTWLTDRILRGFHFHITPP